MSDLTPEQQDVVQRTRLAMVAARSPMVSLVPTSKGPGRPVGNRGTCKRCGETGHYARTCTWTIPRELAKPKRERPPGYVYKRVDGKNHCAVCGELGHNRARHDSQAPSVVAARLVINEGLTLEAAAERADVTRQAVQQALRMHFGDVPTPTQDRWHVARLRSVTLAVAGHTKAEIAAETGISESTVERALAARGIKAHNPRALTEDDIAAAAAAVASGASYQDVAVDVGRSAARIADILRARGVHSEATARGRVDGRTKRAIARVEAGESIPDACRAERCATTVVYTHFKRLREARP